MSFWVQLGILIVTTILSYALAPKKPRQKPPSLEDFSVPTADEGRPLPVVFGTTTITGANVCWYGDYEVDTQTKDGAKTRRYYMGFHFGLCHGPVDSLTKIEVGGKSAWTGDATTSQTISIVKPALFGGRNEGGGIVGDLDVMMGEATQVANTYLSSVQGTPQPAYRGMLSLVFNKGQVAANSTYLEPWAFKVRRISEGWYNDTVWYPERAAVASVLPTATFDVYMQSLNLDNWWKCAFAGGTTDANCGSESYPLEKPSGSTYVTTTDYIVENTYDALGAAPTCITTPDSSSARFTSTTHGTKQLLFDGPGLTGEFTAGAWFKPSVTGNENGIGAFQICGGSANYSGCWITIYQSGLLLIHFGDNYNNGSNNRITYQLIGNSIVPLDGSAFYLALWCNAATATASLDFNLYVNGVKYTKGSDFIHHSGSTTDIAWPGGNCIYGKITHTWGTLYFVGEIDEPYFHNGALADDVHEQIYSLGTVPETPGVGELMNPAHIVYECVTNPAWGMGLPESMLDLVQLEYAADIFATECLGLSFQWLQQEPIESLIQLICDHAGAIFTQDPRTGKFLLIPIRADYASSSLPLYDESNIVAVESFERAGYGELIGEINVVYRDVETNRDASTAPQHNLATIQSQQGVVSETVQYPGIGTLALANRLAARDLAARSVPLARGKLRTNREAWSLIPGDVFLLSWAKLGIVELVCRVVSVDWGTLADGAITIEWAEDVFGLPDATYAGQQTSGWTEPDTNPAPAAAQSAVEVPYAWLVHGLDAYELTQLDASQAPGYGYLLATAPSGVITTQYELWRSKNSGSYAQQDDSATWVPSGVLSTAVVRSDSTITLTGALAPAEVGSLLIVGSGSTAEIMQVTSNDGTATVGVSRGIYDTTPQEHAAAVRVWVLPDFDLVDQTRYADADVVAYKALTVTSADTLDISAATAASVTMDARQIRPYAPGNVLIDDTRTSSTPTSFPDLLLTDLVITWSHRDRLEQGDTVVLQTDSSSYGPEAGTAYNVYVYKDADDSLMTSDTGLSGTTCTLAPPHTERTTVRLEIEAVRDGYPSWQRQVRVFDWSPLGILAEDELKFLWMEDQEKVIARE